MCLFFVDDMIFLSEAKRGTFYVDRKEHAGGGARRRRPCQRRDCKIISQWISGGCSGVQDACSYPAYGFFSQKRYIQKEMTVEDVSARLTGSGPCWGCVGRRTGAGACGSGRGLDPQIGIRTLWWMPSWPSAYLGTRIEMAPVTIGLGPGFVAGKDVHAVVETKRGHDLGRIYYRGSAIPNTGVPGVIGGRCRGAGYLCDGRRDPYRLPDDRRPGTPKVIS